MSANRIWKQSFLSGFYILACIFLTSCSHRNLVIQAPGHDNFSAKGYKTERKFFPPKIPTASKPPSSPNFVAPYVKPTNKKSLIVLDPGHGGKDVGTYSEGPSVYHEKFLNLSTANMVKNYLVQMGYEVAMTRSNDTFIALGERAEFANKKKPALFVSIHYNSAPSKEAEGVEIFYYRAKNDKNRSDESKSLATAILQKILKNTEAKSRGVKHGDLAVIRQTDMPAVLVEGGFLTNKEEREKLGDASYLKRLALGIAQGIDAYAAAQPPRMSL